MAFMKGIALCRRFHLDVVEPVMKDAYAGVPYSSALLGPGSEVLGYDTEMSADHDWVPRVYLFLDQGDFGHAESIRASLRERAPERFYGYPVDVRKTVITTVPRFIEHGLGMKGDIEPLDWLTFPSQALLEITRGDVFRDDHGRLSALRKQFAYYPREVWLYLLASAWQRIGQEEHLMPRAGCIGDELGSAIIASRLVRDLIHLCFLMERQYAPYPKWLGTAFKRLKCADRISPCLWTAQTAATWRAREQAFNQACAHAARMHNALGITETVPEEASPFYDRPFNVMHGERIASLIAARIADPAIQRLAARRLIGSIDQITDNTDFRKLHTWPECEGESARVTLKKLYDPGNKD
ncbi:DUF4037 domain-containing protein [Paenibacillus sp. MWE-103]|uniref:DUF4037 domain-containing protein n=1 Tax=Paenibacillus artemisiicola TaxID=1172618 RepID=A0ABS3W544_9BACL|nr:DUF4037 domain-containing protein [Paenibacillus artemisiicola]MBO7743405.1 DUF4037 domain-containing protein [Paenibacillus artemisiicola]